MFNPQDYLDVSINEPSVKRPPLPPGDYTGQIGEVTARPWTGKKDPTKSGIAWDIPLAITIPPEVQASLGLDQSVINLKDSIMLDLTADGMIDNGPGKNRGMRAYREALNMNNPGDSFSARKMTGQVVRVKIGHDMWNGEPIERVEGVARL